MLKINLKERGQKLIFSESRCCQTWSSKSYKLPSNSLFLVNQQSSQLPKLNSNRNMPNTSQFRLFARRQSKSEKFDIVQTNFSFRFEPLFFIIESNNLQFFISLQTFNIYILNNYTLEIVSSQHAICNGWKHDSAISNNNKQFKFQPKHIQIHLNYTTDAISITNPSIRESPVKSSVIRIVSQFEFIGSKQKRLHNLTLSIQDFQHSKEAAVLKKKKKTDKNYSLSRSGQPFSKSLIRDPKLIVTNDMKSPLQIRARFERRINLLLKKRETQIISQNKNLAFQNKKKDQFDSSCESSPAVVVKVQFNKTQFSKLYLNNTGHHQYLTPRFNHEQNYSIITRKTSQSVKTQYVMEKNKNTKNIFEQKLPQLVQLSLNELNLDYIAQKRSFDIGRPTQQLIQTGVLNQLPTQIQLNRRQTQFFNEQLKIMKNDSFICHQTRIRSFSSDSQIKEIKNESKKIDQLHIKQTKQIAFFDQQIIFNQMSFKEKKIFNFFNYRDRKVDRIRFQQQLISKPSNYLTISQGFIIMS
ncbi:unnamed protein product [Paramecium octaurelia]|uniref:Uncharacterized protein n=1 Tax=Paramecium octaurelia TaxID=43137 RepID=A0A8S1V7E0_PAROT|nr:unnamed protein product [Paramecium octaurelia]